MAWYRLVRGGAFRTLLPWESSAEVDGVVRGMEFVFDMFFGSFSPSWC